MFTLCVSSFLLVLNSGFGFYKLQSHDLLYHFIDYLFFTDITDILVDHNTLLIQCKALPVGSSSLPFLLICID